MAEDINALRDRIQELEELLGMRLPQPRLGVLSTVRKTGWKILGLLLKRGLITREYTYSALYGAKPESEQPVDPRVIDQHICRINKTLKLHGVRVRTEYGVGYYIDEQSREALKSMLGGRQCEDGGIQPIPHSRFHSSEGSVLGLGSTPAK